MGTERQLQRFQQVDRRYILLALLGSMERKKSKQPIIRPSSRYAAFAAVPHDDAKDNLAAALLFAAAFMPMLILMMTAQLRPTKKISCILPLHDTSWEVFSKTVLVGM